jgi:gluconolactonase
VRLRAVVLVAAFAFALSARAQERAFTLDASYPEGPLYRADGAAFVAEMGADQVSLVRDGRKRTFFARRDCGPTAIAPYRDGWAVLCHRAGLVAVVNGDGDEIGVVDDDVDGRRFNDPNDVSADGEGGVYFSDPGAFSRDVPAMGAVVHLSADGVARRVASGLWYPNGVYVDRAHHALFVSETFRRRVLRYPIGPDGSLGQASVFADIDAAAPRARFAEPYREAGPDGLEIGPDGLLYVAIYGEGRVLAFDAAGRFVRAVPAEVRYVTNIAFDRAGGALIVGAHENTRPPYPGRIAYRPALAAPARFP